MNFVRELFEWERKHTLKWRVIANMDMIEEKANESDVGRAVPRPIENGGGRSDADDRGEGQRA